MDSLFSRLEPAVPPGGRLGGSRVRILTHRRSLHYLGLLLGLLFLSIVTRYTALHSDITFFAVAGTLGANLAMLVGLIALVSYAGSQNRLFLFTGASFLGAALLDGARMALVWQSTSAPWGPVVAESGSRWFLPLSLWLGIWVAGRNHGLAERIRGSPLAVWLGGAGLALLCLVCAGTSPRAAASSGVAGHVAAALLYFGALEALLRSRNWPNDVFEHCLMLSLIVGFLCNTLFLAGSSRPYDALFTAAQNLNNLSYLLTLVGLVIATRQRLRRAEGNARSLEEVNETLRLEVDEHQRVRRQFQELAVSLEQRVADRTQESIEAQRTAERAWEDAERARQVQEEANRQLRAEARERIEAERALRESEHRLQLALSAGPIGIWAWDSATGAVQWDAYVYDIFGQTREFSPSLDTVIALIHAEDAERVRGALQTAAGQCAEFDIAYRVVRPDQGIRHVMSRARAVADAAGTGARLIGTVVDVTAHKRGEEELRRREIELSQLVKVRGCLYEVAQLLEQAELPVERIYERTIELLPLCWHQPASTFARLQIGGREYRSKNWRDTATRHNAAIVAASEPLGRLEIGFANPRPEHERFRHDEIQVARMVAASLGRTVGYKRAVEQLRRSERRYRGLFDHLISPCALYEAIIDETGKPADYRFLEINPALERLLGLPAASTLGKTVREVLPDMEQPWIETCGQVALNGKPVHQERYLRQLERYFEITAFSPEKGRFAVVLNDVTERRRAEAEHTAERNLLRTLIDNVPDSIYVKDTARRYLVNNKANLAILGLASENQTRGKTVFDFFPGEHAVLYDADDRAVLDSRAPLIDHEEPYRDSGGRLRCYSTTKVPLFGAGGEVIGLVGISRDITARKRADEALLESRRRMETLLSNLPGMAYRCNNDDHWTMEFVSKGCKAITGLTPDELLAARFADLIDPEDRTMVWEQVQQAIEQRRPFQLEYRLRTADGRSMWLWEQGTAVLSKDGEVEALEGFIADISERKRADEELQRRAKALSASNAELEQFAYAASHDLQEPLRMIASYAQLLDRRYRGKLDNDANEFIRFIVEGAARMQTLIRDLLAYSRASRTAPATERVDLADCARASLANLRAVLDENGAAVEVGPLPKIRGQGTQLVQLFQNLIGNALKYHADAPPRVRVWSERSGDDWLVTVQDNGIGIEPQYHAQIFDLFRRLHGRKEYSGTGIGLAICKKIVENHGGRIWVDSASGQGAAFHFTLPVEGGCTEHAGPGAQDAAAGVSPAPEGH